MAVTTVNLTSNASLNHSPRGGIEGLRKVRLQVLGLEKHFIAFLLPFATKTNMNNYGFFTDMIGDDFKNFLGILRVRSGTL